MTMSGAKKIISGTEIIMWHSNHMVSLRDLIVCEAKIIMFKAEMTASKAKTSISEPDLIIGVTNKIISAPLVYAASWRIFLQLYPGVYYAIRKSR